MLTDFDHHVLVPIRIRQIAAIQSLLVVHGLIDPVPPEVALCARPFVIKPILVNKHPGIVTTVVLGACSSIGHIEEAFSELEAIGHENGNGLATTIAAAAAVVQLDGLAHCDEGGKDQGSFVMLHLFCRNGLILCFFDLLNCHETWLLI